MHEGLVLRELVLDVFGLTVDGSDALFVYTQRLLLDLLEVVELVLQAPVFFNGRMVVVVLGEELVG